MYVLYAMWYSTRGRMVRQAGWLDICMYVCIVCKYKYDICIYILTYLLYVCTSILSIINLLEVKYGVMNVSAWLYEGETISSIISIQGRLFKASMMKTIHIVQYIHCSSAQLFCDFPFKRINISLRQVLYIHTDLIWYRSSPPVLIHPLYA